MTARIRGSRRWAAAAALLALVASILVCSSAAPAAAAPGAAYGAFTFTGTGGQYTGTMTLPAAFPAATIRSNARAVSGIQTGAITYLTAATPFGQVYGSSRSKGYLNLRARADNASSPSTTTYTFVSPTPAGGWGFALGGIDADQVLVQATGPGGNAVAVADLGFAGVFNYCDVPSLRPGRCSGVVAPFDLPRWNPSTGVLRGNDAAGDTAGASGWFQPTVPLTTLSFVFTPRAGSPTYQIWFAALTQDGSTTTTSDPATTTDTCDPTTSSDTPTPTGTTTTNTTTTDTTTTGTTTTGTTPTDTMPTGTTPTGTTTGTTTTGTTPTDTTPTGTTPTGTTTGTTPTGTTTGTTPTGTPTGTTTGTTPTDTTPTDTTPTDTTPTDTTPTASTTADTCVTTTSDTTSSDTTTSDTTGPSNPTVTLPINWAVVQATTSDYLYDPTSNHHNGNISALASTGSHAESLLPVGAALMLGGGLLMLFGRRHGGAHR